MFTAAQRKERAMKRIFDAIERGRTPDRDDMRIAAVCSSCWGMGFYYKSEDSDRKITCKSCGGDGAARNQ